MSMNKNKYVIAIDMDGTLLNDEKDVSKETINYFQELEKEGHIIILASGRPLRALKVYYDKIGLHSPLICYNGAYCCHPYDEEFNETHYTFPKEIIKSIYKDVKPYINNVMCETNDKIWLEKKDEHLAQFFWHEGMNITYGKIDETLNEDPWTMLMQGKSKQYDEYIIKATRKHPGFDVRFWYESEYSEIYFTKTSKAACLNRVLSYYNIPHDNLICIGDADNDIEMVSLAGIGVAMKNANEALKKVAKIITKDDNNHDGVRKVIKEIIEK